MPRTWLKYWKIDQVTSAQSAGKLNHMASEQLHRLLPGDIVWIVSTRPPSQIVALGSIRVNEVISRPRAKRLLPYEPWHARYHVEVPLDQANDAVEVPITGIARRLRFQSSIAPQLNLARGGRLVGQQLQQMRLLTPASASLLSRAWRAGLAAKEEELHDVCRARDRLSTGDRPQVVLARREQAALRQLILGGQGKAQCAICGHLFPAELLIAAHIKPRARCTQREREDWRGNVVPMCALGCDALFEKGYISVTRSGVVEARKSAIETELATRLGTLSGRRCRRWNSSTHRYFAWHHRHAGD